MKCLCCSINTEAGHIKPLRFKWKLYWHIYYIFNSRPGCVDLLHLAPPLLSVMLSDVLHRAASLGLHYQYHCCKKCLGSDEARLTPMSVTFDISCHFCTYISYALWSMTLLHLHKFITVLSTHLELINRSCWRVSDLHHCCTMHYYAELWIKPDWQWYHDTWCQCCTYTIVIVVHMLKWLCWTVSDLHHLHNTLICLWVLLQCWS